MSNAAPGDWDSTQGYVDFDSKTSWVLESFVISRQLLLILSTLYDFAFFYFAETYLMWWVLVYSSYYP